jgi:hypothetical protein
MSGPLRHCGRPECRLCNRHEPDSGHPADDSLATLALGAVAIVALFVLLFVVLP